ncbi:MAG: hypothetical protein RR983_06005 [Massilia sp.]|uniref:UDP-N-acetylmuramate--alanine ligase n=1 Tax=Massilia aurea TaxID=373040 RepID=A0A7W9X3A7_9BURK|nr:hypothetical protein [Massilia aurea]MBB6135648.1 hypothetical protein [Massilia aurea]MBD8541069.1 hypothetical protein [Oxalobacteraceae sp. CFBP 8761]MBD8625662.1 hypothetical protein [Oxalobacteraceae sp. CFBP 8753]MBD8630112.1 hypothetical protein [Oxalobacteraceae sp. CFBP 8755]
MMPNLNNDLIQLRAEIALVAARMVAQDGADIDTARRKAARQVLGVNQPVPNMMPDDIQVEDEVRKYLALFGGPDHSERLAQLRATALQVMEALADFNPYITGPVLQGTAGEHDDIHLQLFADSAKEVQIYLLNRNVNIEISETPHFKGGRHAPVETVSFPWMKETVHAQLFEYQDLRGALKPRADGRPQRLDAAGLRALIAADSTLEQNE